ncbi:MAG: sensor histidine kinase [Myxococcota bacterium]
MDQAAIPVNHRLEGVPTREILAGLARLHDLVLAFDGGGRVVWLSDRLRELCGNEQELMGVQWKALLPRVRDVGRSMQLGKLLCERGHLNRVRLPIRGRDGECVELDISAFTVQPASESDTESGLTVVILRETGDRAREADEVGDHLDLHRSILDASPDAVVAIDRSSFVTYANRAARRLMEDHEESVVGKPIALFLPHAAGFGKLASSIRPHGEIDGQEIEVRLPGRSSAWLAITTRSIRDDRGGIVGSVAFLRNVTESRNLRDRLERQNAELESFVHTVSHDLRSPLVSLLGFSRLLGKDYDDQLDETGRHFLNRIEQAGRTMEGLIADLLELTRIGRSGEPRTLVDPRAVLQQLKAELKPRIDEQEVELHLPASPPLLACDRTRLYQVFSNLIGNALSHMGPCEEPRIEVGIEEEAERHHITVSDNGKGIPVREQERIFDVFYTVAPKADGQQSSGVGLAIVKRIAEASNGSVWVESEPGRGTSFHLTLPR